MRILRLVLRWDLKVRSRGIFSSGIISCVVFSAGFPFAFPVIPYQIPSGIQYRSVYNLIHYRFLFMRILAWPLSTDIQAQYYMDYAHITSPQSKSSANSEIQIPKILNPSKQDSQHQSCQAVVPWYPSSPRYPSPSTPISPPLISVPISSPSARLSSGDTVLSPPVLTTDDLETSMWETGNLVNGAKEIVFETKVNGRTVLGNGRALITISELEMSHKKPKL